ncbi:MAG: head GIN domain-containing protein [Moheibacter sp.]
MKTFLLILSTLMLVNSCAQDANGNIIKETRNTDRSFNEIESAGAFDVFIRDSPQDGKIILEGQSDVLKNIEVEVENNTLVIRHKKGFSFRNYKKVNVYVNAQNLKGIGLSGSGNILSEGVHKVPQFKVALSGSGNIKANAEAQQVKAAISGSGNIELAGETANFEAGISGSGDIEAAELKSKNVKISNSGSGNIKIHADEKITAVSAGSGDILYKGKAEQIDVKISGSGNLRKM